MNTEANPMRKFLISYSWTCPGDHGFGNTYAQSPELTRQLIEVAQSEITEKIASREGPRVTVVVLNVVELEG